MPRSRSRLPDERIRSRISAYVYGDVLVLAAVLAFEPATHPTWSAVLAIVLTMGTTYLAHVVSDLVGSDVVGADGTASAARLAHLREELRDALPIAVAGVGPAVFIALGVGGLITTTVAQGLAAGYVIVRLAAIGIVRRRLTGAAAPAATIASGIALAVVGAVLALAKALLSH